MAVYTALEYANMHFVYGECRCNANAAARLYRERYPNNRHPDHRVFINVHRSLSEGRFPNQVHGEGRHRNPYEDVVLQAVQEDPSASVRGIETSTGVSRSTAHRILKKNEFHPYHVQRVQSLLPRDYAPRVAFCQRMLERHREDKKGRGRPKANGTQSEAKSDTKKRGRPPAPTRTKESTKSSDDEQAPAAKRGRGRPKGSKKKSAAKGKSAPVEGRGRGRPRKDPPPKKDAASTEEEQDEDEDDEGSEEQ